MASNGIEQKAKTKTWEECMSEALEDNSGKDLSMTQFIKIAADLYADQFKIHLSPDRVLTQEEFNKQYAHYQELLALEDVLKFQSEVPEPTSVDVSMAWSDWYDDNWGHNTQTAWESGIRWFKQKIGRK